MAVIPLGNGKGITWEPTTELRCARCCEAFDPATSLKTVYLMHNASDAEGGQNLSIRTYWYFHVACRDIEKTLKELGANIRWRSHEMPFLLGFTIEKDGFRRRYKQAEKRAEIFRPGVYETLRTQWRSALGALDTEVTSTVDITSIGMTDEPLPLVPAMPPAVPLPPVDQKPDWLALRFAILVRDKYRCRMCGVAASDGDHVRLEVDHIIPRAKGGTDDPRNLWVLCFACNRGKWTHDLAPAPSATNGLTERQTVAAAIAVLSRTDGNPDGPADLLQEDFS